MYKMQVLTESFEAKDLNIIDALMLLNSLLIILSIFSMILTKIQ